MDGLVWSNGGKILTGETEISKYKNIMEINKQKTSNSQQRLNITINTGDKIITNPQMISEKFNSYFTEVI